MSDVLPNDSIPRGYSEQFEACSEFFEYNPNTGGLRMIQKEGNALRYNDVMGKLVLGYGFSFEEYAALERLVEEDVIKMYQELADITPQDFK